MFSAQASQTYSMHTQDGVRLDADVYRPNIKGPNGEGPFPVLLMRQPYGRAIASTVVYAHPSWYAAQGYIVVIQDVRGRGTSAGKFTLFENEVADGEDTLKWASQLPNCDGQVGMYGFSYQGMTQLYAAQSAAQSKVQSKITALKTIAPAMTGYYPYEDWAYENGALCLQLGLNWAIQLAAETARIEGNALTHQKLVAAAHRLPLFDNLPARPDVLEGVDSFFHDWVANPHSNEYWQRLTPQLKNVDMPMLHIGGWFDPYLRGDLRLYQEMTARSAYAQPLCVGPWGHIPWGRKVGEMDFGSAAMSPIDELQIQWFDHVLKGKALPEEALSVSLFEMGSNQWRGFDAWPESSNRPYFLQSNGLANIREDGGKLSWEAVPDVRYDSVVHDPWNPAPALGGHSTIPAGVFERTAVDARGDVLTYTSAPLIDEMRVVGVVEVVGAIASTAPSYDLCAVLSRVQGGKVYNLTQGYQRIDQAESTTAVPVTLPLHPTCFSLAPGECLRLSLSAACFPAYPVNPGTGAQPSAARLIEAEIVVLAIAIGGKNGMQINLPLAAADD
ncbi:MAG: CocE/NonD family hydrolase [Phormidesmis sp.]